MNILFSIYCNNYQNLTKLSADIVTESQKTGAQIIEKVKSGFVSMLKSISNSFTCLMRTFSYLNINKNVNSDKVERVYVETPHFFAIEDKKTTVVESNAEKSTSQAEFDKLKYAMHARLNIVFKNNN